jgi:hypothetical protein
MNGQRDTISGAAEPAAFPTGHTSLRETLKAAAFLGALSIIAGLIVPPTDELPHCDDWDFVETARHLLSTGRLVLSDWPAFTLVTHVLWGSLFGAVFGPSYFAFRLSMFVMSWLGAVGLFSWTRRLGWSFGDALATAAIISLNPLNLVYQNSFMSDVTAVTGMVLLLRALMVPVQKAGHAIGVGLLAAFGYLARQTAVVPLIAECVLAVPAFVRRRRVDGGLLCGLGVFVPFVIGHWCWRESTGVPYSVVITARPALPPWGELFDRLAIFVLAPSLYLAPVTLGRWQRLAQRFCRRGLLA